MMSRSMVVVWLLGVGLVAGLAPLLKEILAFCRWAICGVQSSESLKIDDSPPMTRARSSESYKWQ